MAFVFILVISFLVVLLFLVPKFLQTKRVEQPSTPIKQRSNGEQNQCIDCLNRLFNEKKLQPKSIITFRECNQVYMNILMNLSQRYEVICLSQEKQDLGPIKCLQYSNQQGVSAIVRSLKPKVHIDNQSYDNLHNFVNIQGWEYVNELI